jgi:glutamate-1-semialdehyde 2,1-aminomutase
MQIYRRESVIEHLRRQGASLRVQAEQAIRRHGLQDHVRLVGRSCCLAYATLDADGRPSQAFRSLFLQETIRRGVLMPSLVVSYAHKDGDISRTVDAIDGALGVYREALEGGMARYLVGRPSQVVYRRYNSFEPAGAP